MSSRRLVLIILTGIVLSIVLLCYCLQLRSRLSNTASPQAIIETKTAIDTTPTQSGQPVRLIIPLLTVDTAIENVGLTAAGAMDVPKNPAAVAWYQLGQRPGEIGTAVIGGHYGLWNNGQRSVFDELHTLHLGDIVYTEDDLGVRTTFVVRDSRSYDPLADVPEVFTSNDGKSHLNLVTCEGKWDPVSKSYSKRLVVFTDKE